MSKENRLNPQGLSRRSIELMGCILPDPGNLVVSLDLLAGEPTVTSHFTRDQYYVYATFDGCGKAPYYAGSVLMIDDVYLMGASISPFGSAKLKEAFNKKWPAGSFADQWLADPEVIKKDLKSLRQLAKAQILGFGYGLGPKKAVKTLYEQGYVISEKDARSFHKAYWTLFSGIKDFSDRLGRMQEERGYTINPFGFRGTPEPHKAYNFFIQSSVSGILHVYTAKLMAAAPYTKYLACIHDELLIECPTHLLEQFRTDAQIATDSLNEDLQWSVAIRTGFAPGDSWFTAK